MSNRDLENRPASLVPPGLNPGPPGLVRPSALYLVTFPEWQDLRQDLARGILPVDLDGKLIRLAKADLVGQYVAQQSRLFIALLKANGETGFNHASKAECERLLKVLAYVRKDDDAVPDYRVGGFVDDHQEIRAAALELGPLLRAFKAWRLRHQVPAMWLN